MRKKLGDEVEDHRRKSPGPNQMTWNVDGLDVHACSLKHLESRIKRLQEVLGTGYELAVKVACLDMLKNLVDFRVKPDRVAVCTVEQKKFQEDQSTAVC
jgi:hypothetical protein